MCINAVKLSWRIQQDFSRRLFRRVDTLCTWSFQQVTWSSHGSQITFDFVNRIKFFFLSLCFFFTWAALKNYKRHILIFFFEKKNHEIKIYFFFQKNNKFLFTYRKIDSNNLRYDCFTTFVQSVKCIWLGCLNRFPHTWLILLFN